MPTADKTRHTENSRIVWLLSHPFGTVLYIAVIYEADSPCMKYVYLSNEGKFIWFQLEDQVWPLQQESTMYDVYGNCNCFSVLETAIYYYFYIIILIYLILCTVLGRVS